MSTLVSRKQTKPLLLLLLPAVAVMLLYCVTPALASCHEHRTCEECVQKNCCFNQVEGTCLERFKNTNTCFAPRGFNLLALRAKFLDHRQYCDHESFIRASQAVQRFLGHLSERSENREDLTDFCHGFNKKNLLDTKVAAGRLGLILLPHIAVFNAEASHEELEPELSFTDDTLRIIQRLPAKIACLGTSVLLREAPQEQGLTLPTRRTSEVFIDTTDLGENEKHPYYWCEQHQSNDVAHFLIDLNMVLRTGLVYDWCHHFTMQPIRDIN